MKQINKNTLWNAVGNTAYNGLQWFITIIVTNKAGLGTAGILSLAMSVSLTFRTAAYFGIRNFQVSDRKNKYSFGDYFLLRIITCTASLFICMLFTATSKYEGNRTSAIFFYMTFRISESFSDLFQGVMQKHERLDIAGIFLTIKAVVTTLFFVVSFYINNSLNTGLLFMSIAAMGETFIFELPVAKRVCGENIVIKLENCRCLATETLPLFVYLLETSVIFNIPKYFISLSYDDADLGAYSNIFSMALIIQAIFQYIYVPFTTEFSRLEDAKNKSKSKCLEIKLVSVFVVIMVLFATAAHTGGMQFLILIFGEEISGYRSIILPTLLGICTYSITAFASMLKIIKREFKGLIIGHTIGAVISAVSTPFFIEMYNLNGASFGLALASTTILCFMIID